MKKIVVTGFLPFLGNTVNPSALLLPELKQPENAELVTQVLPVEFQKSGELLKTLVEKEKPDILLSLGQAGNSPCLALERVAVNLDCARSASGKGVSPDEAGMTPVDVKIDPDGPDAFFSDLPVWKLAEQLNGAGVPAAISYSAGTYVCNHVMYVGASLRKEYPGMQTGFVHLPFLPEQLSSMQDQNGRYAMDFEQMKKGIQIILEALCSENE